MRNSGSIWRREISSVSFRRKSSKPGISRKSFQLRRPKERKLMHCGGLMKCKQGTCRSGAKYSSDTFYKFISLLLLGLYIHVRKYVWIIPHLKERTKTTNKKHPPSPFQTDCKPRLMKNSKPETNVITSNTSLLRLRQYPKTDGRCSGLVVLRLQARLEKKGECWASFSMRG